MVNYILARRVKTLLVIASLLLLLLAQVASASHTSSSMPDLTVSDLGVNENGYVYFTLSNIGNADVSTKKMWFSKLSVDGKLKRIYPWKRYVKGDLEAGQSSTIITKYILPGGEHDVRIYVDTRDRVYESNENNNSMEKTLNGVDTEYADLIISDISVNSENVLSVQMKNIGTENVNGEVAGTTQVYVNGVKYSFDWDDLSSDDFLDAGGSTNITVSTLSAETYDVFACVDTSNVVYESDDSNNCKNKEDIVISESAQADLIVKAIGLNASGYIYFSMANIGNKDATSDVGITSYYVDDVSMGAYLWSNLSNTDFLKADSSGNTVTTITTNTKLSSGNHSVKAFIDSTSAISESNENNNTLTVSLNGSNY